MKLKALIVVDVQNDFCEPNGSLAVPGSSEIIPVINSLKLKSSIYHSVILTKDCHPLNHVSFASAHNKAMPFTTILAPDTLQPIQLWPDHCIEGTFGYQFSSRLNVLPTDIIIQKGKIQNVESFSAFGAGVEDTKLLDLFHKQNIAIVDVVGLAADFCVKATAEDAARHGFEVRIIEDATRAVGGIEKFAEIKKDLLKQNIQFILSDEVSELLE